MTDNNKIQFDSVDADVRYHTRVLCAVMIEETADKNELVRAEVELDLFEAEHWRKYKGTADERRSHIMANHGPEYTQLLQDTAEAKAALNRSKQSVATAKANLALAERLTDMGLVEYEVINIPF